ncbi:MAG: nucleotidyltransferase domain-containing protein [Chitinispirillaceae bacterium]|nr:nucleotidyltransferase domain-containing protein [Chitinispirillaceae bacterium]
MKKTNEFDLLKKTLSSLPSKKIILFGSQARGDAGAGSDYDILIITEKSLPRSENYFVASELRRSLAQEYIDADIIIKSEEEVETCKNIRGCLIRNALPEGVVL